MSGAERSTGPTFPWGTPIPGSTRGPSLAHADPISASPLNGHVPVDDDPCMSYPSARPSSTPIGSKSDDIGASAPRAVGGLRSVRTFLTGASDRLTERWPGVRRWSRRGRDREAPTTEHGDDPPQEVRPWKYWTADDRVQPPPETTRRPEPG